MAGLFFPGMGGLNFPIVEQENEPSHQTASSAMQVAQESRIELRDLRKEVERLTLLSQALWELVRDKLAMTDEDLERISQEIDLRDGLQDGRMTSHALQCPKCGRVSNSRHKKCLYCGLLFEGDAFG